MASTPLNAYNPQHKHNSPSFRDCNAQDAYEEAPSVNTTCRTSAVPSVHFARSGFQCPAERTQAKENLRSRSCFPRIASQNVYTDVGKWREDAEDIGAEDLSANPLWLEKASRLDKQLSDSGPPETIVIVEDVDSSSDEEESLGFSYHQVGRHHNKHVSDEASLASWQRGRPLIRPTRVYQGNLPNSDAFGGTTSDTFEGSVSPLSLDSRPPSANPRAEEWGAVLDDCWPALDQSM
jgi:hypothetical protein